VIAQEHQDHFIAEFDTLLENTVMESDTHDVTLVEKSHVNHDLNLKPRVVVESERHHDEERASQEKDDGVGAHVVSSGIMELVHGSNLLLDFWISQIMPITP
jgi:hypothetical protein